MNSGVFLAKSHQEGRTALDFLSQLPQTGLLIISYWCCSLLSGLGFWIDIFGSSTCKLGHLVNRINYMSIWDNEEQNSTAEGPPPLMQVSLSLFFGGHNLLPLGHFKQGHQNSARVLLPLT